MKYFNTFKITSVFVVMLLVAAAGCDSITGDPDLPIPLNETINEEATGAFIRILSVESEALIINEFDENQVYSFTGEVYDSDQGQKTETINFYATYVPTERDLDPSEEGLVKSITVSDLPVSEESGLPRDTFTLTGPEMVNAIPNLEESDLTLGSRFDIRMEVVMKDGTTFSKDDVSPAVTGGFYSAPMQGRASLVIRLPKDEFVGSYTFKQQNPGPTVAWASQFTAGDNSDGWLFNSQSDGSDGEFTVELSVDPDNEVSGRVFEATYLEEWGYGPSNVRIAFSDDVTLGGEVDNGLGCGENITLGISPNGGEYDFNDDTQFEMIVLENAREDCGRVSEEVVFQVTKN